MGCRIRVGTVMTWSSDGSSSALLQIRAAETDDQELLDENFVADGARIEVGRPGPHGERPIRVDVDGGPIAVRHAAGVEVDGDARACPRDDAPLPTPEISASTCSRGHCAGRFCLSDALGPTVEAVFGKAPRTRTLIPSVADWIRERIVYQPGSSDHLTTADQTLLARQGVCRDMTHLAV